MKFLSAIILMFLSFTTHAQNELGQYLKTHHYSFDLEEGFDQKATDTLVYKFSSYKLVLQAEGGSHSLAIYDKLPLIWLKFLNTHFGLTHFFLEFGHSSAVCANNYLQTGDTANLYNSVAGQYWKQYLDLNFKLAPKQQVKSFGIDFNRPSSYLKALKQLIPKIQPPESIKRNIELIYNSDDSVKECEYILNINSALKEGLKKNNQDYIHFLGQNFKDFERILLNKGTCSDVYSNRNYNLADNFLSFAEETGDNIYYGELGMAHTILKNKVAATIINNSAAFKDKVCVINLYCYNCTTAKEEVSNWPLKKIDHDIIEYFLPYCNSDFTFFDLSGNSEVIKKYRAYGQFLIVAKNQH